MLELVDKRLQIKIPLQGLNSNLGVGKTVTLTMVNPTIAEADYPISKIERKKGAYLGTDDIWWFRIVIVRRKNYRYYKSN